MSPPGAAARRRAFLRSLLLQAGWNDEGMQNLGFAYSVEPLARPGRGALRRHLYCFNTQPHMAGFVIGAVGALEEASAAAERIEALKRSMGAALAGIGDALFWGALRPACAALALLAGLLLERPSAAPFKGAWLAAAALFLLAFNVPAVLVRWRGLGEACRLGEGVVGELKRVDWQAWIRRLRWAGLAATAGIVLVLAKDARSAGIVVPAAGGAVFLGALGLKTAGASLLQAYGVILTAGIAISVLGGSP